MLNTGWMNFEKLIPRLALTPGDPAGIGPDIVISAAQQSLDCELIVIADPDLMQERAHLLDHPLYLQQFNSDQPTERHQPGKLKILPVSCQTRVTPGKPDTNNSAYVLKTLEIACNGCLDKTFSAMVTGPVNKAIINEAGLPFSGHTEYLAKLCGNACPVMMLADQKLRVALVTTHLPLSSVSNSITHDVLEQVINIVWNDLQARFAIKNPKMLVCGLNPHAGEDGHLGTEEKNTIIPVLEKLRKKGLQLTGPVPADTAFTAESLETCDVVITMYHDQGLPVLKSRGFGEIVNITLGLPVIRTSVDHGTAFTLAGTGRAKSSSLTSAINCAINLCASIKKQDNNENIIKTRSIKAL